MRCLDPVAVPLIAKPRLVGMVLANADDEVAHWDEGMNQAASGPLSFPAVSVVIGGAYAPASQVVRHPLSRGPQSADIVR